MYLNMLRPSKPWLHPMISNNRQAQTLSKLLLLGVISTGFSLLSIEAARAADVVFNFKIDSSGTAPFDANNNPGNDANATNNVVRTQDIITYKWEYNISNGAANNVVL